MPFAEGESGNPGGRPKRAKMTYDALMLELKARESASTEASPKGLRKIVAKVADLAEEGERWATEFIRDTVDGKPAQQVNLADDEGGPLTVVLKQFVLSADDQPPK